MSVLDLASLRLVVHLRGLRLCVAEELLQEVLWHPAVGEVLRDGVAQKVRVDALADSGGLGGAPHELLDAPLRVRAPLPRAKERAALPVAEV